MVPALVLLVRLLLLMPRLAGAGKGYRSHLSVLLAAGIFMGGTAAAPSAPGKPDAEVERPKLVQVHLASGNHFVHDAEALSDGAVVLVWCDSATGAVGGASCQASAAEPSGHLRGDRMALLRGLALCGEIDVARLTDGTLAVVGTCIVPDRVSRRTTWIEIYGGGGLTSGPFELGNRDRDHSSPRVVPAADGGAWVVWAERADSEEVHTLRAQQIDAQGAPMGEPLSVSPEGDLPTLGHTAVEIEGGFAAAWLTRDPAGDSVIRLRRFDGGGKPFGDPVGIVLPPSQTASGLELASDRSGRVTLMWRADDPRGGGPSRLMAASYLSSGELCVEPMVVADGTTPVIGNPSLAGQGDRQAISWFERDRGSSVLKVQEWSPETGLVGEPSAVPAAPAKQGFFLRALPVQGGGGFDVLWKPDGSGPGSEAADLHWLRMADHRTPSRLARHGIGSSADGP